MGPELWLGAGLAVSVGLLATGWWARGLSARERERWHEAREFALVQQLEAALKQQKGATEAARLVVEGHRIALAATRGDRPDLVRLAGPAAGAPPGDPAGTSEREPGPEGGSDPGAPRDDPDPGGERLLGGEG